MTVLRMEILAEIEAFHIRAVGRPVCELLSSIWRRQLVDKYLLRIDPVETERKVI